MRPMAASTGSARAAAAAAVAAAAQRPRVAVIGAGFAGLAAALTLQRSGCCDVLVLEASGRAGGRARTERWDDDVALELGATWIHGLGTPETPNPIFKHAVEAGLLRANPTPEKWWGSQFLLPGAAQPLSKEQQIAVTHVLAAWDQAVESLPPDAAGTTAQHLQAAWAALQGSGRLAPEQAEVAQRAWRWRELLQRAMDGCDTTAAESAQGQAIYEEFAGGIHTALPGGMQAVAESMAAQVADLRYGHAVQRIDWGGTATASSSGGPVVIACADGTTVEADAAVVTVSLGVLKAQHRQLFSPPLPPAKAAAIERLSIGVVDKIFLDFSLRADDQTAAEPTAATAAGGNAADGAGSAPSASASSSPAVSFALLWSEAWDSAGGSHAAVPPPSAAEAQLPAWAKGIFALRFGGPEVKQAGAAAAPAGPQQQQQQKGAAAGSDGATAGTVAAAGASAHGEEAAEAEEAEEEEFRHLAEPAQPTSDQAVAWLTGAAAQQMEAASDEEVLAVLRQLPAVFPQLRLPEGASWDRVRLRRSSWGSDPLFRGSYAYIGVAASPADVAALAEPVYAAAASSSGGDGGSGSGSGGGCGSVDQAAPRLLFAGDACHETYMGCMHAAYLTAQQAAELLVQKWQAAGSA